jgi:hypothetical protein
MRDEKETRAMSSSSRKPSVAGRNRFWAGLASKRLLDGEAGREDRSSVYVGIDGPLNAQTPCDLKINQPRHWVQKERR